MILPERIIDMPISTFANRLLLVGACFAMAPLVWADPPIQYEEQKLLSSNGAAGGFGTSIDVSGDTAVVGSGYAVRNGQATGAAFVYTRDAGGAWTEEAELVANASAGPANIGPPVAVDGDTAVIGAPVSLSPQGSVYVYQREPGGDWTEQAQLFPSAPENGSRVDRFGRSVAISGDTMLIGALGRVYVFTRDAGGNWLEQTVLIDTGGSTPDYFTEQIVLDGDRAVISALGQDEDGNDTGSVYVLTRDRNGEWSSEANLRPGDGYWGGRYDPFGNDVAMSGDTVLAAAGNRVYVFTRDDGGAWSQQALLTGDQRPTFVRDSVSSVAISGDTAAFQRSGVNYVYTRNASGVWSERVELQASDDAAANFYTESTAISGDTALLVTPGDDDQENDSGAVYLFDLGNLEPRVSLHCSRDLSADDTVGIAVVKGDQVTIKALDGTLIGQSSLNGLDDVIDTALMDDTNGNGAPELVALSRSSATAVVRDLLTGADLGTVEFPADLGPVDLELAGDQTGNGIPDLVSLGRDPARAQIRDALTSGLVNDVGFTRYVTAKDLAIYPDLDGSGAPGLAVLAENRQPEHADKIEIRNASSGETIREIWLGKHWQVLEQDRIGDLNGNGSEEVAVLQQEPQYLGGVRVQIRDIETSAWVNFVGFANKYPPQALVTIPDINGNGADELVVFGRHARDRNQTGVQKAVIKDARTGEKLNQLWFDRDFPGRDFVSCGDINGNGAADVALLGQRPEDGQFQVMVQDARTGERLAFVWF